MARVPDLVEFCTTHNLKMLTVAELIRYRMQHERYVHRVGEALVNTAYGEFRVIAYESEVDGGDSHLALVRGEIEKGDAPVLVRMHSHCLIGDVFGSAGCDCRATLEAAMSAIGTEGRGALIYLHQSAKGFSVEKIGDRAAISFHHDRTSASLPEAERRIQREDRPGGADFIGSEPAQNWLLTNHPRRLAALEGFDIEVVENVPVALQKYSGYCCTRPDRSPSCPEQMFRPRMVFVSWISLSRIKNCTGWYFPEPQITAISPAICFRVIRPRVPQPGQERTAQ